MGIIVTALIWFIFGAIVGTLFITIGISMIVYAASKHNDAKAYEVLEKMYSIGKSFYKK